jgi:hypothetical protein
VQQCTQGGSQQVDPEVPLVSRRTASESRSAIDTDALALLDPKASNVIEEKLATVAGALKPGRVDLCTFKVACHFADTNLDVGAGLWRQRFELGKLKLGSDRQPIGGVVAECKRRR